MVESSLSTLERSVACRLSPVAYCLSCGAYLRLNTRAPHGRTLHGLCLPLNDCFDYYDYRYSKRPLEVICSYAQSIRVCNGMYQIMIVMYERVQYSICEIASHRNLALALFHHQLDRHPVLVKDPPFDIPFLSPPNSSNRRSTRPSFRPARRLTTARPPRIHSIRLKFSSAIRTVVQPPPFGTVVNILNSIPTEIHEDKDNTRVLDIV